MYTCGSVPLVYFIILVLLAAPNEKIIGLVIHIHACTVSMQVEEIMIPVNISTPVQTKMYIHMRSTEEKVYGW